MDAADAESAEVIEDGNTGRTDNFHICGQFSAGRSGVERCLR